MNDIVLFLIAVVAFAFEIIEHIGKIPAKHIKIILITQLILGTVYCIFAFNIISLFRLYLLSAPLIAYVTYLVSLFIVGTSFIKENLMIKKVQFDTKLKLKMNAELLKNLLSSSVEEIVFRAVFQFALTRLMGNVYIPAIIVCIIFTAVHYKNGIAIVQMLDIFFFSIVISALFAIFTNVVFTIIIHIIRNAFIIVQKYIVQQRKIDRFNHLMKISNKRKIGENR